MKEMEQYLHRVFCTVKHLILVLVVLLDAETSKKIDRCWRRAWTMGTEQQLLSGTRLTFPCYTTTQSGLATCSTVQAISTTWYVPCVQERSEKSSGQGKENPQAKEA